VLFGARQSVPSTRVLHPILWAFCGHGWCVILKSLKYWRAVKNISDNFYTIDIIM
jgi:hypothetical protein